MKKGQLMFNIVTSMGYMFAREFRLFSNQTGLLFNGGAPNIEHPTVEEVVFGYSDKFGLSKIDMLINTYHAPQLERYKTYLRSVKYLHKNGVKITFSTTNNNFSNPRSIASYTGNYTRTMPNERAMHCPVPQRIGYNNGKQSNFDPIDQLSYEECFKRLNLYLLDASRLLNNYRELYQKHH